MDSFYEKLKKAKRPIIIVGGNTWTKDAVNKLTQFVDDNSIPVLTSYRAQDRFDEDLALYLARCNANHRDLSLNF